MLVDTDNAPAVVLGRGQARGLLAPSDPDFTLALLFARIDAPFVAVPDPHSAAGIRDRLNKTFPRLYRDGAPGYRLIYQQHDLAALRAPTANREMTMRILVVDDSEDWRDLTEAALMAAATRTSPPPTRRPTPTASSASAAGRPTAAAAVDLIVLDIVMPEIDGIEACARIRSDPRYVDVPVIMVTALNDMDTLSNAFVAGATDYITKPFNRVELLARVRSALKLKAELDRRKARERELIVAVALDLGRPRHRRAGSTR